MDTYIVAVIQKYYQVVFPMASSSSTVDTQKVLNSLVSAEEKMSLPKNCSDGARRAHKSASAGKKASLIPTRV